MCVCVCTKRKIRNEGRIVFYSERGVHLVKSEDQFTYKDYMWIVLVLHERGNNHG